MARVLWTAILFLLVWASVLPALSQNSDFCGICGERQFSKLYLLSDRVRGRQVIGCERCVRLTQRCATCRLPVFHGFQTLTDGRYLCAEDSRLAIMEVSQSSAIFAEVKRDMISLFSGLGVVPDRNIAVRLVDQRELARMFLGTPGAHPDSSLQGLTRTKRFGKDSFEHHIYLSNGLSRERLSAVAAHEYTHAWIHENISIDRGLDRDTEEAFCELAAYQIMCQRGEEVEKRMILENAYTRGKIDVLVKASDDFQFYRVAQWIKTGSDNTLEQGRVERVIALKSAPVSFLGYLPVVHARAPEVLTLKGLSGKLPNRFALINDATLQAGEEARVRISSSNVLVRCEEIRERSVIVKVNGAAETLELQLMGEP